jgi:hypothetical protein
MESQEKSEALSRRSCEVKSSFRDLATTGIDRIAATRRLLSNRNLFCGVTVKSAIAITLCLLSLSGCEDAPPSPKFGHDRNAVYDDAKPAAVRAVRD